MAKNAGKLWEKKCTDALHEQGYHLVIRFPDVYLGYRGAVGVKSPPDLLAVNSIEVALIECKAQKITDKSQRMPLAKIRDHQLDYLTTFHREGPSNTHSYIAACYYNALRGKARIFEGYLIRFDEWESHENVTGRKSISLTEARKLYRRIA